jgi:hypothetical protein
MKNTLSYQAYLKSPYKSIKHSTYFEIYDELFSRYRNKKITFVEIGVLGGGSLFMWREFFGPQARIIGIDLNPNAKKWEENGFEIYIGSQSDKDFWSEFINDIGSVDVVLDDGGHTYEQQIITTEMLLSLIKDNGMLVVEDTHTSYLNGFGPKRYSFVNYTKNMLDKINQRFGHFNSTLSDSRVWSVQSFESIIAFHINRKASNLLSEATNNNGADDSAKDFRYEGNQTIDSFQKNVSRFRFLKHIPGMKFLKNATLNTIVNLTSNKNSIKKYF